MTRPVPPPEFEIARIENAAHLVTARACEQCDAEMVVIARWPGSDLPRAVEIVHCAGCPFGDDGVVT